MGMQYIHYNTFQKKKNIVHENLQNYNTRIHTLILQYKNIKSSITGTYQLRFPCLNGKK
jgi:hypothetical protein